MKRTSKEKTHILCRKRRKAAVMKMLETPKRMSFLKMSNGVEPLDATITIAYIRRIKTN